MAKVGDALERHWLAAAARSGLGVLDLLHAHLALKAEDRKLRESRLALCALALGVLVEGLGLLGVESAE